MRIQDTGLLGFTTLSNDAQWCVPNENFNTTSPVFC
jgi:hypothetical protein